MQKTSIIIIILCIIIIILCYTVYIFIKNSYEPHWNSTITYDDLTKTAKTGDLLIFKNNYQNYQTKYILGQKYSHTAFIYKKDNTLYILEAVGDDELKIIGIPEKTGANLVLLKPRLETYNGKVFIKRLNKELDKKRIEKLEYLINNKYKDIKFNIPIMETAIKCVLMIKDSPERQKYYNSNMYCSMFVATVLTDIELLKFNKETRCILPQCLVEIYQNAVMQDNYLYQRDISLVTFK
jgi:hypothetical protein